MGCDLTKPPAESQDTLPAGQGLGTLSTSGRNHQHRTNKPSSAPDPARNSNPLAAPRNEEAGAAESVSQTQPAGQAVHYEIPEAAGGAAALAMLDVAASSEYHHQGAALPEVHQEASLPGVAEASRAVHLPPVAVQPPHTCRDRQNPTTHHVHSTLHRSASDSPLPVGGAPRRRHPASSASSPSAARPALSAKHSSGGGSSGRSGGEVWRIPVGMSLWLQEQGLQLTNNVEDTISCVGEGDGNSTADVVTEDILGGAYMSLGPSVSELGEILSARTSKHSSLVAYDDTWSQDRLDDDDYPWEEGDLTLLGAYAKPA